ncbi:MAG: hypothetical protein Kow00127_10270 [Bacteroidales bacterium]
MPFLNFFDVKLRHDKNSASFATKIIQSIGEIKAENFDNGLIQQSALFKALAHPARLQILLFLSERKTCITGDISDEIPLGRTTVNQHIKELKKAGLLKGHVEGVHTKYCLNPDKVKELKTIIQKFADGLHCE